MKYRTRISIDKLFKVVFKATGMLVLALLGGIFAMLVYNSISFFLDIKPLDFITGMEWAPTAKKPKIRYAALNY